MSFNDRYKFIHLTKQLSNRIIVTYSSDKNICIKSDNILTLLSKSKLEVTSNNYIPSGIQYLTRSDSITNR